MKVRVFYVRVMERTPTQTGPRLTFLSERVLFVTAIELMVRYQQLERG